jgi:aminoglycoside 6'-N-acetyltransferase I
MFELKILGASDLPLLMNAAEGVFDYSVQETYSRELLEDPRHHIVVAMVDGVVIGFASAVHYIHPDKPPELWINEVGVAAEHQGRGIGKAIMKEMLQLGQSLGCINSWVLTDKTNTAANGLYKSVGGQISEEETVMYGFSAIEKKKNSGL